ncbi:ANTAR domain-containing protein [Nocardia sp. NBC_01503]|uniref:ANTAR domain-containing protein n=1 Tax=Nocardia sp. NBC_01503 TaxID=2975997 RepID=UPI002E7BD8AF|nr:ANTAR domain-containing protein [Nocardia sp. NBC_01503]WTL33302.1 ANTAR domain-containing protein [Nocardia sp. NBC_01503]
MKAGHSAVARFLAVLRELGADGNSAPVHGERLCAALIQVLPVDEAALVLALPENRWEVLGSSGVIAAHLADAEAVVGEGPGPAAHLAGTPIRVPDFANVMAAGRWPLLAQWDRLPQTLESICSIPLRLGAIKVGFLDLVGADRVLGGVQSYTDALQVADVITTVLLAALSPPVRAGGRDIDGLALGPWWEQSVSAREIHQATGMVAVQLDSSAAVAYARLVGHAFVSGATLSETAAAVVARRLRFPPDHHHDPNPVP